MARPYSHNSSIELTFYAYNFAFKNLQILMNLPLCNKVLVETSKNSDLIVTSSAAEGRKQQAVSAALSSILKIVINSIMEGNGFH